MTFEQWVKSVVGNARVSPSDMRQLQGDWARFRARQQDVMFEKRKEQAQDEWARKMACEIAGRPGRTADFIEDFLNRDDIRRTEVVGASPGRAEREARESFDDWMDRLDGGIHG